MTKKEIRYVTLIKENENLIYKVASLYTSSRENREDLMQEIAYQIWKSFDSFQGKSAQSTWMYRIALNTAIQYLKKEKRSIPKTELLTIASFKEETHLDDLDEELKNLMSAIQKLKQLDKGIVLLSLEGKSHKEIASITELSVSNVGTRMQRIKKRLKEELEK